MSLGEEPTEPADAGVDGRVEEHGDVSPAHYSRVARSRVRAALFGDAPSPKVGRYTLLSLLGQGGMGMVYSAYDEELERRVAIKVIRSDVADDAARARFMREARSMARLSHPHVVVVYEVGQHGDDLFVAMEHIRGTTLGAWVREQARSWREILDAFMQAGQGLAAAHAVGVVHRDFKPANVMVGEDGRARVLDFGLAVHASRMRSETDQSSVHARSERGGSSVTRTGALMGTPRYMAPEQSEGGADARSDQFSFCVALYESLFDAHPFGEGPLDRPAAVAPPGRVPSWVAAPIMRGLSLDPGRRHASMEDLLQALGADPGRRRRRWAMGLTGVVLVAGAWASGSAVGTSDEGPCQDVDQQLRASFGEARRAQLFDAFEQTGLRYATGAAQAVDAALEEYAEAWKQGYGEACEAVRARQQSAALLDARMRCLADRRRDLGALMSVLVEADAEVVEKSVRVLQELEPVEACADPDHVLDDVEPVPSGQVEAVEGVRKQIARAAALSAAGRLDDSYEVAEQASARAREIGYTPLLGEALLREGRAALDLSHARRSEETLREAFAVASRAKDRRTSFRTAHALVNLLERLDRYDAGLAWADVARALLPEIGGEGALQELELEGSLANLYARAGRLDEARAAGQRALALEQDGAASEPTDLVRVLEALGNIEQQAGELSKGLEYFQRAQQLQEDRWGPDHPLVASGRINVGAGYHRMGKLDEAFGEYEVIRARLEAAYGPRHVRLVAVMHNMALILSQWGRNDEALPLMQQALRIEEGHLGPEHPDVANSLISIGQVHLAQGRDSDALKTFERALQIDESRLGPEHPQTNTARAQVGRALLALGRYEEALQPLQTTLANQEASEIGSHHDAALTLEHIGSAHLGQGDHAKALQAFERAQAILAGNEADTSRTDATLLVGRSRALLGLGRAPEALEAATDALRLREAAETGRPGRLGEARWLWIQSKSATTGKTDALRAEARKAMKELEKGGTSYADQRAEVERWLRGV